MKHSTLFLLITLFCSATPLPASPQLLEAMKEGFSEPGSSARPRAYWNWLHGDVTLKGLTRDLEEAKAKGMAGLEIWDTGAIKNPDHFIPEGKPFLGEHSVRAIRHTMSEAERLGLVLGLVTSSGWNAGGPWVTPEQASKNLFFAETTSEGPGRIEKRLPFPELPKNCPRDADGNPLWSLEVAVLAWPDHPDRRITDPSQIIDLSSKVKDGVLHWEVPPGTWRVVRFVCSNNGQKLIAASPKSRGLFIDFFDPAATRFHIETIAGRIGLEKGGDPRPFEYFEVDSMELYEGIPWTPKFPDWFKEERGYGIQEWLPVLAGWAVVDEEASDRFRYDFRNAISDLLIFSHYTTGSRVCAEYGLEFAGEAGGPGSPIWDTCPVDALKALGHVDIPRGEFWVENTNNIFLIKEVASASHIYGKRIVDAESWTTWRRYNDGPFDLKRVVDRAFCEGLNRITYHVFAHSLPEHGYPGRAYHAGTDMNPQTVWWPAVGPFMEYLSRCCKLLQQGTFAADVAYYYGDQAPNFWPLHHNVPDIPRLPGLGAGYDYDVVNTEVILDRMRVKDGRIVLPDGMSYRLLVLPDQPQMPLKVLRKLKALVDDGATLLGPRPSSIPGLHRHEEKTKALREIADAMWENTESGQRKCGKGRVVWGMTAEDWLQSQNITPDVSSADVEVGTRLQWIHRRSEVADWYFVCNRSLEAMDAVCRFRVEDRAPQFWDPASGQIGTAPEYKPVDGGTEVRVQLPPGGSTFVVFRKEPISAPARRLVFAKDDSSLPRPHVLDGPWELSFDPAWGAPARVEWPELVSWTESDIIGIRHYSGVGTYRKNFTVASLPTSPDQRIWLDVGDVREVAEVSVNGQDAGILWKPPYRLDITDFLKAGQNRLEIKVMNNWVNRMVLDATLPEDKRLTRTNIYEGEGWLRNQGFELHPSGLFGPVRLLSSKKL
jgi:hypothetical protein